MYTSSYFIYRGPDAVSIAGGVPKWYFGRQYKNLAPLYWFFKEYKESLSTLEYNAGVGKLCPELAAEKKLIIQQKYTDRYNKEVLGKLDPYQVYEDLGENAVLLCWEPPSKFCHRKLVAKWFENELGIIVPEFSIK